MIDFVNVPMLIGTIVASKKASYYELDAHLSLEDAYDILEIALVDGHNKSVVMENGSKNNRRSGNSRRS